MKNEFIPFIAHSDLTKEIYIQYSRTKKIAVTDQVIIAMEQTGRMGQKTGKWIEHDDDWANVYYECSVCKEPFVLIDGTPADNLYNFCPNCGADMRGGK